MSLQDLRPDLLYLIVFGPGKGESVVIRSPSNQWIVIDSCRIQRRIPGRFLLEQAHTDWSALVLTHPHEDHYQGFDELLAMQSNGLVGCSDPRVEDPAAWMLSDDAAKVLSGGTLEAIFSSLQERWQRDESSRWLLRRGGQLQVGELELEVLHPSEAVAAAGFTDLNRLSSAILLKWHKVQLLLGSDVLAMDWHEIEQSYPDLANHAALKIPHHGSQGAFHGSYSAPSDNPRFWVGTPFNNQRLPRFGPDEGLALFLQAEDPIYFTALPVAQAAQFSVPIDTSREELNLGSPRRTNEENLPGDLRIQLDAVIPSSDLTCYIAIGFDENGSALDFRRGPGSVKISEASSLRAQPSRLK